MNGKNNMIRIKKNKYFIEDKITIDNDLPFNNDFIDKFLNNSMLGPKNCLVNFSGIKINKPNETLDTLCPDCVGCGCPLAQTESTNYPDLEISYKFNKDVYRCDELSSEYSSKNFLFSGCSYTIGTGIPYEGTWAYQLNKELNGEKFYNIAVNGASYKTIIYDVYNYINTYGKPKAVFILFPDISRVIGFVDSLSSIEVKTRLLNEEYPNESSRFFTQDLLYFDFYNSICALEDYLKSIDVPFLWGTWHQETEEVLNLVSKNFNNYVKIFTNSNSAKYFKDVKIENNMSLRYWDLSRDLTHPGIKTHMIIKNIFLYEWKKKYENIN
jgi:hypothetical protein